MRRIHTISSSTSSNHIQYYNNSSLLSIAHQTYQVLSISSFTSSNHILFFFYYLHKIKYISNIYMFESHFETYINIIIIPLLHFRHIRTQKQCVQNNVYDRYSFHLRISNSSLQVSTSTGRRWPIRQRLDRRRRVIHALLPWPAASYKFPGKFSRNMVLSPVRKHDRVFITVNGRIHYALTTWN